MENVQIAELLFSGLRIALPLMFAAFGGMLSEKAGVANIALEAFLLFSSFAAAAIMAVSHNIALSIAGGILASILVGVIFGFFTVKTKSDQIIVGTALNILAMGTIPVLCKALFNVSGQTPSLSMDQRINSTTAFVITAVLIFIMILVIFKKTVFGLHIVASGDNPQALRTQGVSVDKVRWLAVLVGAAIVGIGGVYLSIGAGSGYTRNMSAGRGFIALAALIFGRWKPIPTLFTCLFFGLLDALQIFLQSSLNFQIPTQFVQALPYIVTLVFLAFLSGRNFAPSAINRPDL